MSSTTTCPNCNKFVHAATVNFHLDLCLNRLEGEEDGGHGLRGLEGALVGKENSGQVRKRRRQSADVAAPARIFDAASSSSASMVAGMATVTCPACGKQGIALNDLNLHLDSALCTASFDLPERGVQGDDAVLEGGAAPPGLRVLRDFVSEQEEEELVRRLDQGTWRQYKFNGSSHSQLFGVRPNWAARSARLPKSEDGELEMPDWLDYVMERFQKTHPALAAWWPNGCNANEYMPGRGDFLKAHFDDRQLAGEIIVNVCLLSDCVMTFRKPNSSVQYRVTLPRRSASIMSRSARWEFTHEIAHQDFLGDRRISINFRQMVL